MSGSYLSGAACLLGEHDEDHTSIANLAERAAEFKLPAKATLWGWGRIRRTERSVAALAVGAGRATLAAAGVAADTVDALVLCSTSIVGPAEAHGQLFSDVLGGLGLGDIAFYGLTLNRCTNLLAGIDLADALVRSGRYRRVLVLTSDRVLDEAERMVSYALFSDGAAGCLIGADPAGEAFEVLGCANAQDTPSLSWTAEISAELAKAVNNKLLHRHGMKLGDICSLAHLNVFLPLVTMKERQAGFTPDQLYTENISRIGHCYAADPLINLLDRGSHPGHHYLLAASVPGSRFGVLLRKVEGGQS
jgi:3-oxoacyl-[acyl-carrier-protein] synthase-3